MKTFMVFGFSYRYLLVYIKTLEPAWKALIIRAAPFIA